MVDDVEAAGADRAGRAEDGDTAPACRGGRCGVGHHTEVIRWPRPTLGGYDIGAIEYPGTSGGSGGSGGGGTSSGGTPTASFSYTTSGLTATFADASTDTGGTISTHAWNFGDGATSTTTSPNHAYAAAGTYNVSETVTDGVTGNTSTATQSITVTAPTSGSGSGSGSGGCASGHKKKCQ